MECRKRPASTSTTYMRGIVELVILYLLVFTDTATQLNIEFTNEHRIAVEKAIRNAVNKNGFVEMKERLGQTKEGFTKMEEKDFQQMLTGMLADDR